MEKKEGIEMLVFEKGIDGAPEITNEMEEKFLSNSMDYLIEDETKSPYYDNMEYYLNNKERNPLYLFVKATLGAAWKSGVLQWLGKWVVAPTATSALATFILNGFPKMNPKQHVAGAGYYESGNVVMVCQKLLKAHGFTYLVADGSFGPKTKSAVMQFQGLHGLTQDGSCGPKTWDKLINCPYICV